MKNSRQEQILSIIAEQEILTQNQLLDALSARGIVATQATVSRDIRELHLIKEPSAGGQPRYVCSKEGKENDRAAKLKKILRECVVSYATAQNIVVIKTLPGLANAAGSAIDSMSVRALVGTLAGDDTLFLAMKDNASAEAFCREIGGML